MWTILVLLTLAKVKAAPVDMEFDAVTSRVRPVTVMETEVVTVNAKRDQVTETATDTVIVGKNGKVWSTVTETIIANEETTYTAQASTPIILKTSHVERDQATETAQQSTPIILTTSNVKRDQAIETQTAQQSGTLVVHKRDEATETAQSSTPIILTTSNVKHDQATETAQQSGTLVVRDQVTETETVVVGTDGSVWPTVTETVKPSPTMKPNEEVPTITSEPFNKRHESYLSTTWTTLHKPKATLTQYMWTKRNQAESTPIVVKTAAATPAMETETVEDSKARLVVPTATADSSKVDWPYDPDFCRAFPKYCFVRLPEPDIPVPNPLPVPPHPWPVVKKSEVNEDEHEPKGARKEVEDWLEDFEEEMEHCEKHWTFGCPDLLPIWPADETEQTEAPQDEHESKDPEWAHWSEDPEDFDEWCKHTPGCEWSWWNPSAVEAEQ